MITPELTAYIQNQLDTGVLREIIVKTLKEQGYSDEQIREGFFSLSSMDTKTSTKKFLGSIELFKKTLAIFSKRWKIYIFISFITIFLTHFYFSAFYILLGFTNNLIEKATPLIQENTVFYVIESCLFILFGSVISIFGTTALYALVFKHKEKISILQALKISYNRFIPVVLTVALFVFIIIGGYFLFFIPGVIFSIWFVFALYLAIEENVSGMKALLLSREYVRGRFLSILWRFVLFAIILFVVYIVLFTFGNALSGLLALISGIDIMIISNNIVVLINFIFQLFILPFMIIYVYLMLDNLKSTKTYIKVSKKKSVRIILYFFVVLGGFIIAIFIWISYIVLYATVPLYKDYSDLLFLDKSIMEPLDQAEEARLEEGLETLQTGLDFYYVENAIYPVSLDELVPNYIAKTPSRFKYTQLSSGDEYELCIIDIPNTPDEIIMNKRCFYSPDFSR